MVKGLSAIVLVIWLSTSLFFPSGLYAQSLTISPNPVNFGSQKVNLQGDPLPIKLERKSTNPITISSPTPPEGFTILTNECVNQPPSWRECQIKVAFKATQRGPISRSLSIAYTENDVPQSPITVELKGEGLGPKFTVSPLVPRFGEVSIGGSQSLAIVISNDGDPATPKADIKIQEGTESYEPSQSSCSFAAGQPCTVNLTFHPKNKGLAPGKLTVQFDRENSIDVILMGYGRDEQKQNAAEAPAVQSRNAQAAASQPVGLDAPAPHTGKKCSGSIPQDGTVKEGMNCAYSLFDYDEARDIFGKRVANTYFMVELNIQNLQQNSDFIVHNLDFWFMGKKNGKAELIYPFASRSSSLVLGVAKRGQAQDMRNITLRSLEAGGSIAGGAAAFIERTGGRFNKWVNLFQGAGLEGFRSVWPDFTVDQVARLLNFGFEPNVVVPRSTVIRRVAFVSQRLFFNDAERRAFRKGECPPDTSGEIPSPAEGSSPEHKKPPKSGNEGAPDNNDNKECSRTWILDRMSVFVEGAHVKEFKPEAVDITSISTQGEKLLPSSKPITTYLTGSRLRKLSGVEFQRSSAGVSKADPLIKIANFKKDNDNLATTEVTVTCGIAPGPRYLYFKLDDVEQPQQTSLYLEVPSAEDGGKISISPDKAQKDKLSTTDLTIEGATGGWSVLSTDHVGSITEGVSVIEESAAVGGKIKFKIKADPSSSADQIPLVVCGTAGMNAGKRSTPFALKIEP